LAARRPDHGASRNSRESPLKRKEEDEMQMPNGQPALPLLAPLKNGIGPVPTEVAINKIVGSDRKEWIALQFATNSGVHFFFFEEEAFKIFLDRGREVVSPIVNGSPALAQQLADALVKRRPQ
jgi:hypothetical protein